MVIKTYNKITGVKLLSIYELVDLINEYAELHHHKKLSARTLKFELIDISNMTSQEYNDIFLMEEISSSNTNSPLSKTFSETEERIEDETEYRVISKFNEVETGEAFGNRSSTLEQKNFRQKGKTETGSGRENIHLKVGQIKQTYSEQM